MSSKKQANPSPAKIKPFSAGGWKNLEGWNQHLALLKEQGVPDDAPLTRPFSWRGKSVRGKAPLGRLEKKKPS